MPSMIPEDPPPIEGTGSPREGTRVADELKQVIYPNNSRQEFIDFHAGIVTEIHQATAAELKDGSDLTFDQLQHTDDGIAGPFSQSVFLWTMDQVTYTGPISFVKVFIRSRLLLNSGLDPGSTNQTAIFNGFFSGPSPEMPNNPAFTDFVTTMTVNPQDSAAWTATAINAGKFGWRVDDEEPPAPTDFFTEVSEFRVEIWGPPSVSLGGYTSYDLGIFDAGSPEPSVLPEVAKKIAQGDRRFMV